MPRRYSPSITLKSAGTLCSSSGKSVMPHPCRADEVGVFSQRSPSQFCSFGGNETAAFTYDSVNTIQEKIGALHHAATQNDYVRREQGDQVGQTEAEVVVVGLRLHHSYSQLVTLNRKLADSLCS